MRQSCSRTGDVRCFGGGRWWWWVGLSYFSVLTLCPGGRRGGVRMSVVAVVRDGVIKSQLWPLRFDDDEITAAADDDCGFESELRSQRRTDQSRIPPREE